MDHQPLRATMTWYDRLLLERDELRDRLFKLWSVLIKPPEEIGSSQLILMEDQVSVMLEYLLILEDRIRLADDERTCC